MIIIICRFNKSNLKSMATPSNQTDNSNNPPGQPPATKSDEAPPSLSLLTSMGLQLGSIVLIFGVENLFDLLIYLLGLGLLHQHIAVVRRDQRKGLFANFQLILLKKRRARWSRAAVDGEDREDSNLHR